MNQIISLLIALSLSTIWQEVRAIESNSPEWSNPEITRLGDLVNAGELEQAIAELEELVTAEPQNADAFNLLGFAKRKQGAFGDAANYYLQALEIESDHTGALEYQGELYLQLDRPEKARMNLIRLKEICGVACAEYLDLDQAIKSYEAQKK